MTNYPRPLTPHKHPLHPLTNTHPLRPAYSYTSYLKVKECLELMNSRVGETHRARERERERERDEYI